MSKIPTIMDIKAVTFRGPTPDFSNLPPLPEELRTLLHHVNGLIAHEGGFHLRGACVEPTWHSLAEVWLGAHALHRLYPAVQVEDVPFAQNCVGDQFLLRRGMVHELLGETGVVRSLGIGMKEFLEELEKGADTYLHLDLLALFHARGGGLQPGELLLVYPPLCTQESGDAVSLRAVPALAHMYYLADFARQVSSLPPGAKIKIKIKR